MKSELCWTPAVWCLLLIATHAVTHCVWVRPQSVSLELSAGGENVILSTLVKCLLSNQLFRQIWHFPNFSPVSGALLSGVCCWMLGWTHSHSLQYVRPSFFFFNQNSPESPVRVTVSVAVRVRIRRHPATGRVHVGEIKPPIESLQESYVY